MTDLQRRNPETGEWEEFFHENEKAWRYDERRDRFEFISEKTLERRRFWRLVLCGAVFVATTMAFFMYQRLL
jgi:hypothetical protein